VTGLANRALFRDRLGHALARGRRSDAETAVLFFDLDDFKSVNDRLGHGVGDGLLRAVGDRLLAAARVGDTVARLGGDEFAVLLESTDGADATAVAARMLAALRDPVQCQDHEISIRASVGIALRSAAADTAEDLLRHADIAMYEAKRLGGGRAMVFEPERHDASLTRLELKTDLAGAAERGELWLAYQPIVDLATAVTVGFEALARWNHPTRGAVTPAEFIPLAEQSDLIVSIGRWVIREACRQLAAWPAARGPQELTMSVNLSGRQLSDPDLVADVGAALAESAIAPARLVLEITESALIEDVDLAVATLGRLHELGVRLAVDDFGTGYSSLSYLRRFPIDLLKIDQSFVSGLDGGAAPTELLRSIVNLGGTLGLTTLAEGIEEPGQVEALLAVGAQLGQGYHFARPMPPGEIRFAPSDPELPPGSTEAAAADAVRPSSRGRRPVPRPIRSDAAGILES
jgi:diguanylate cyclase (GGDEF)-like protein